MSDSKQKEHFAAGVLLIAILLVFFHHALHPDRVLSPADRIFSTPFFAELAPPGFSEPANPLLFDQVYQFAPWRYFVWKSLREGTFPLWNPYSYCGTPLIATMQAAVFYPVNVLLAPLPFHLTFVWSAILRLWIAGISTYFLMRRYGLSLTPSAEVTQTQPRAFMVYGAVSAQSDQEVRALLKQDPEKVFQRLVLSSDSLETRFIELPRGEEHPANTVAMVAYEPHQSRWKVDTSQDGYLFMSDSYYPGWKAYRDGTPIPLYRANLAFRAVFIPAGRHEVTFAFEPMSVRIGLAVGALAALMIAALLVWS